MLEALNELEDHYSFGPLIGAQGRALAMEITVSGALGSGGMPMDLDVPLESLGPDLTLAGPPGGCSLSSCPDSGTEDSDVVDGTSRRSFSRLLSEGMSTGGPLLARVQKHGRQQRLILWRWVLRRPTAPALLIPRNRVQCSNRTWPS